MLNCSMRASGGHTGQDEDKKGPGEEAVCPDLTAVPFSKLLQYLQEANELFCDIPNPFFCPSTQVFDTNRYSQIDLAATHINS